MVQLQLLFSISFAATLSSGALAACDRDKILAVAKTYVDAQVAGTVTTLQPLLADTATYRHNNKAADLKTSVLSKALKLDHSRTIADTSACATYTEMISTAGPYVIGTQLRFNEDGSKITLVDTIAATTGNWMFNAGKTLQSVATESWEVLDESKRTTRETLKAAADAYLDMWSDGTAINKVPWGTPCKRTEGSMVVTPNCRVGAPSGGSSSMKISDRRYVIDEMIGSVDVLCSFGGSMPDSHEFRLESGQLHMVHTITV
jgi:hypothetical protein